MKPKNLANLWKESELGKRAMVAIFRTSGCAWRKCTMCNYASESYHGKINDNVIYSQLEEALSCYDGEEIVKLYTSGSFLDEREIPRSARRKIIESFEDAEKIVIESRPEFITEENLADILDFSDVVEVAIGLETVSDDVRLRAINKGFTLKDFEKSTAILKEHGFGIRTYILLKPPFLYEKEAIEDAIKSVKYAKEFSDVVSINPMNVQKNTLVEKMFKDGEYDPPWFWSLIEVIKRTDGVVISKPSGGGSIRGIHNCGKCDSQIMNILKDYNNTLRRNLFDKIYCECRELWKDYLEMEVLAASYGISDMRRGKIQSFNS